MSRVPGKAGPEGAARISARLGMGDPRIRRNAQERQEQDTEIELPLFMTKKQRLGLKPAKAVAQLNQGADPQATVDKINELIGVLKDAKLMKE